MPRTGRPIALCGLGASWASIGVVALGLLSMHGLEAPVAANAMPVRRAAGAEATSGHVAAQMNDGHAGAGHLAGGVLEGFRRPGPGRTPMHDHLAWACVWLAVGAFAFACALRAEGIHMSTHNREEFSGAAAGATSRAPPSAVRLSMTGALLR